MFLLMLALSRIFHISHISYFPNKNCHVVLIRLKVIYHPLYSMNKFVTNKSMLPQDGAQVFPYMG